MRSGGEKKHFFNLHSPLYALKGKRDNLCRVKGGGGDERGGEVLPEHIFFLRDGGGEGGRERGHLTDLKKKGKEEGEVHFRSSLEKRGDPGHDSLSRGGGGRGKIYSVNVGPPTLLKTEKGGRRGEKGKDNSCPIDRP